MHSVSSAIARRNANSFSEGTSFMERDVKYCITGFYRNRTSQKTKQRIHSRSLDSQFAIEKKEEVRENHKNQGYTATK